MKSVIISLFIVISIATEVSAACKWRYVNEINKDIKHASDLLSEFAKCQGSCDFLAKGLNQSLFRLRQSSQCGAHILTRENGNAIGFIGDRFKLIYKQKTGRNWSREEIDLPGDTAAAGDFWATKPAPQKPYSVWKPPVAKPSVPKPQVVQRTAQPPVWKAPQPQPAAKPLQKVVQRPVQIQQQPKPVPKVGQKMAISREAYRALWPERHAQPQRRRAPQRVANNRKRVATKTPQHIAKQRAMQQRKQQIIQQQLVQKKNAQKRAIQHRLNQQRLARLRLQKRRMLHARLERNKRIQQQRMIIAQRNRNR